MRVLVFSPFYNDTAYSYISDIIVSAIQQMTVYRDIETPVYFKSVLKLPTIANVCVF